MTIDWVNTPMYNTLMSLAAGVGLLQVVLLGRAIYLRKPFSPDGFALGFGVSGVVLFLMGLHMSLTWPIARIAAYDNIIFGEPAVAFGAMLLAASLYLWKRGDMLVPSVGVGVAPDRPDVADDRDRRAIAALGLPLSLFAFAIGLACFGIAAAGWRYTLWAAPPQEPISGNFSDHPMFEATFIALIYVAVGVGAVLLPLALLQPARLTVTVIGIAWTLAGLAFLLFGSLNYFTHIGLILHTTATG